MSTSRRLLELTLRETQTILAEQLGLAVGAVAAKDLADGRIGQLVADIAAAAALVAATPSHADRGSWNRAAKLAATAATTRACRTAMEMPGATTYVESHPFVQHFLKQPNATTRSMK